MSNVKVVEEMVNMIVAQRAYEVNSKAVQASDEMMQIRMSQRFPLLMIGVMTGSLGAVPGLLWLGGAISVIFFPALAALAIWLYLLVFVFSGLWFQHYCLEMLARLRSTPIAGDPANIIEQH